MVASNAQLEAKGTWQLPYDSLAATGLLRVLAALTLERLARAVWPLHSTLLITKLQASQKIDIAMRTHTCVLLFELGAEAALGPRLS
mmetsp:Transcript_8712/g.19361  ORF Transcript_8712/g.19361 Transcript_8712/m.19361 type:complete len:87 (-) Transcript_8712:955-1215(-)